MRAPRVRYPVREAGSPDLGLHIPVNGVPGRAGRGRVREEVPELRADDLDFLSEVERDLNDLLDVDLLEGRHGVLHLDEVDGALDFLERRIEVRVGDLGIVAATGLEELAVVRLVVADLVDRDAEGVLGDIEVAVRQGAGAVLRPVVELYEIVGRADVVRDRLDPDRLQLRGDQLQRVDAGLAGRAAELDLGAQAVLHADAIGTSLPTGSVEDRSGLGGIVGGRGLIREVVRIRRDVRVGDLLEAAQDASVDLVLVDRVGERQSELRVGSRAAGAAVGDGGGGAG